jgi:subtilisin-like proprotein convertase family protein
MPKVPKVGSGRSSRGALAAAAAFLAVATWAIVAGLPAPPAKQASEGPAAVESGATSPSRTNSGANFDASHQRQERSPAAGDSSAGSGRDLFSAGFEYRSPGPSHKVVVYDPAQPSEIDGFEETYRGPGFVVGKTTKAVREVPGLIQVRDDMNILRLQAASFDTTVGEPPIPANLASSVRDDRRFLALVQAPGPISDGWLESVKATGAQLVSYLPENAYLVLADRSVYDKLEDLKNRGSVQYVGLYHPFYALGAVPPDSADEAPAKTVAVLVPDTLEGHLLFARYGARVASAKIGDMLVGFLEANEVSMTEIAKEYPVVRIEPLPPMRLHDEKSAMWVAGGRTSAMTDAAAPQYLAWFSSKGFGGDPGFAVEVSDSGVSAGMSSVHPDLTGPGGQSRVIAAFDYTGSGTVADSDGHGTAVAGIVAGRNASTGTSAEDTAGFNYGIGVDPDARLVVSKVMQSAATGGLSTEYVLTGPERAYRAGARISNASWGADPPYNSYNIITALFDSYVRDASRDPGSQPMAFVFAAGNVGPGGSTINSPANGKNVIGVGGSENNRPNWVDACDNVAGDYYPPSERADNMVDLLDYSSRGPTLDGRLKPDLVAPAHHVVTLKAADGVCSGAPLPSAYTSSAGTSFAAPHVAGALSLIRRWFSLRNWKEPSPAMLKAYLLSGTVRLTGAGTASVFPYYNQGFGALALDSVLTDNVVPLIDQSVVFSETGQVFEVTLPVVDQTKPVVVTMAFTDQPGNSGGAAYVNDLDLEVVAAGNTYRAGVGSGEFTSPGGLPDPKNTVERIKLPPGTASSVTVRVRARNIAGNGVPGNTDITDQDFALVVSNLGSGPILTLDSFRVTDLGDYNGYVGSPEPFEVVATLRNIGTSQASGVVGTLASLTPGTTLQVATASFGAILPGQTSTNGRPYNGVFSGSCLAGVSFKLDVTYGTTTLSFRFTAPTDARGAASVKSVDLAIPDGGMAEAQVELPETGSIQDVAVAVYVADHAYIGDLDFSVVSPRGTEIWLSNRRGGNASFASLSFHDQAYQPASAIGSPDGFAFGSFRPEQPLASLSGQPSGGTWRIRVYDRVLGGVQGRISLAGLAVITGCEEVKCTRRPAAPASSAYLAEGATSGAFDTWILVANPNPRAVTACVTFLTSSGPVPGPVLRLAPLARQSISADRWVDSYDVATIVEGLDGSVLAERAMYSYQPGLVGAHAVKASTSLARTWFLAEGATSGPFETWVLVANPSATETANVSITYMTDGGPRGGPSFALGPQQRRSVRVDDRVDTYHVSTFVQSAGAPVVVERATYIAPGERSGATASQGTTAAATDWYLAEGATAGPFETWILIANPSDTTSAGATVEFLTEAGSQRRLDIVIPPRSRRTIRADDYVESYNVSTVVHATSGSVVAERAMYISDSPLGKGAASGEGVTQQGAEWFAVEGATAGAFETWVLVANPNQTTTTVRVDFLSTGGVAASTTRTLPPLSRLSIRADDFVNSYDVATRVTVVSGGNVIVERSTYTPPESTRDPTASPAARIR